jgi:low affinity Fe/Cu permease
VSSSKLSWFTRAAKWASHATGRPSTFIGAILIILIWAISGPLFGFSDTWQLVINTSTTIITFLMVFLIQNTQNRDTEALQIKLDELLRAVDSARNTMIDLEELDDDELDAIREDYLKLARKARTKVKRGKDNNNVVIEVEEEDGKSKNVTEKSGGR